MKKMKKISERIIQDIKSKILEVSKK